MKCVFYRAKQVRKTRNTTQRRASGVQQPARAGTVAGAFAMEFSDVYVQTGGLCQYSPDGASFAVAAEHRLIIRDADTMAVRSVCEGSVSCRCCVESLGLLLLVRTSWSSSPSAIADTESLLVPCRKHLLGVDNVFVR